MSGIIGGFINFIKGLFGSIFGIFKKTGGSASGYFLEMDDAKGLGTSTPAPKVAPAKTETKSAPAKTEAKSAPAKTEAPKPQPVDVAKALNLPQPTVTTFAPDYLLTTTTNGRRRPGANMASYLDMARQTKTARG